VRQATQGLNVSRAREAGADDTNAYPFHDPSNTDFLDFGADICLK
jgi:hypothetical protein